MSQATILIADDDRGIRTVLAQALARQGYDTACTGYAATLWHWIADGHGDLAIADVILPDEDGLDLVPRLRKRRPDLPIIVMSAHSTLMTAVKATERGAFDYMPKPFDVTEVVQAVERALAQPVQPAAAPEDPWPGDETLPLIGQAPAMQEIYRAMARIMGTDLSVLIAGESGTGKELIARALHDYGRRRNGPFVALNMAAIPRELIESELFGHEKGAFTGATQRQPGRFEQARGGTLFLDEIGDMPPEAQTRLLRVLQDGEFTTVGGRSPVKADVRIITATHQDLRTLIRNGLFRQDLYYRLNVVPLRVPPLRERLADVPLLVRHFLAQAAEQGLGSKALDGDAIARLKNYRWPGNVRELENLIKRLAALHSQDVIGPAAVVAELGEDGAKVTSPGAGPQASPGSLSEAVAQHLQPYFAAHEDGLPAGGLYERVLREVERPLLALTLEATGGNQVRAAQVLGLNRNTVRKKVRELGLETR